MAAVYQYFRLYDGILIARTEEKKQIRCSEWRFSDPTHPTLRDKFTKQIFPGKSVAVAAVYQFTKAIIRFPVIYGSYQLRGFNFTWKSIAVYQHFRLYDGILIAVQKKRNKFGVLNGDFGSYAS